MLQLFRKVTGMISPFKLLWKYIELRLVYLCHKKLGIQMLFSSHKLFHSKVSILFFSQRRESNTYALSTRNVSLSLNPLSASVALT